MNLKNKIQADLVIHAPTLVGLLQEAKSTLLTKGVRNQSQRGLVWGLNQILLVWTHPSQDSQRYPFWSKEADSWYQDIFVKKQSANQPERLAEKGDLLFPYKYAQRSRYYDLGWGSLLAVLIATRKLGRELAEVLKSYQHFELWLTQISELVHLQTVLATLSWWRRELIEYWLDNQSRLEIIIERSRIDTLERITKEIKNFPTTRRSITPSFMNLSDYLLDPMMGVPPYQNFQLLPSSSNSPLSSLHWHRSLDASGGAQLDFNHDFNWLSFACRKTGRKMGSIAILVGNLHLYASSDSQARRAIASNHRIEDWLKKVTDGYLSGQGTPAKLFKKDAYMSNAQRVYSLLRK